MKTNVSSPLGLPVVRKGGRGQIVDACLKSSYIWRSVKIFMLDINMRVLVINAEDEGFVDYLIKCGDGRLPKDESIGKFKVNVPEDLLFPDTLDDLIDWVILMPVLTYDGPHLGPSFVQQIPQSILSMQRL